MNEAFVFGALFMVSCVMIANANYHHPTHHSYHCVPKISIKHHTVPVYVPYTVYEKYPVYKYEHYPVKVPVYVKVKEEYHHDKHYEHHDKHYGHHDKHYEHHDKHYEHHDKHYDDHNNHYLDQADNKKAAAAKA